MNIIEGSGKWSLEVAINTWSLMLSWSKGRKHFFLTPVTLDHALSALSDFRFLLIFPMKSDDLSVAEVLRVFEEWE